MDFIKIFFVKPAANNKNRIYKPMEKHVFLCSS